MRRPLRALLSAFATSILATFSLAGELPETPETLLLLRFDGDLLGVAGESPLASGGTGFVSGLVGEAVHVGQPGYIRYPKANNLVSTEGTIEFWIRPDWNGNQDTTTRAFFEVGDNFNDRMRLSIDGANNVGFLQWGDDPQTPTVEHDVEKGLYTSGAEWIAGTWYHVAAAWHGADRTMAFYINGQLVDSRLDGIQIANFSTQHMTIGAESGDVSPAEATFDEFRITNRMLTAAEVQQDYLTALEETPPPTYPILRGAMPGGLTQIDLSALPWTDPEPVLTPAAPDLLFYRVDGLSRLHIAKKGDTLSIYTVWPNPDSPANSDEWLVTHHDGIGLMQPRLLVLNFSNDTSHDEALTIIDSMVRAIGESSRWHGTEHPERAPFLDYRIEKFVDLRDDPPETTCDGNSTRYPRKPGSPLYNFEYSALYGDTFAGYYGYPDPGEPDRFLTLGDLVNRGIVHEVWFIANHGSCGSPLETIELKQYYDLVFRKTGYGPAGNSHDVGVPWIGRSLRLTFINPHMGVGCAMENLGHGFEGYRHYDALPYLTRYLDEYAGFDLDERWGLPFSSFYQYGVGDQNSFPTPDTLVAHYQGTNRTVHDYVAIGGNVHFTPNGRSRYDLSNVDPVMSTIRSWRTGNGPQGEDLAEPFTGAEFQPFYELAPDCMGPFLIYWRQNMPGLDNTARDDFGGPMKNWWPFLFY